MVAKARMHDAGRDVALRDALRQRHGVARIGDSAVHSQLKEGKPLTVTDPNMTRFLMSLDDSWTLSCMPSSTASRATSSCRRRRPATIGDLVQALKEIFKRDNPVQIIGTRHGEKLYESLVSREEMARVEDMEQLLPDPGRQPGSELRDVFHRRRGGNFELDDYTSHNTERLNVAQVKALLLKLDFIQPD